MPKMIRALSSKGHCADYPVEKFRIRVSAYALIVHNGKLLVVQSKGSRSRWFPGGEVEVGECMQDALKRECREEAGIEIEVLELFDTREVFFYYEPEDLGFQGYLFFFRAQALTIELCHASEIDDTDVEYVEWLEPAWLSKKDFLPPGDEIFNKLFGR